jgi:hypothetical protein
MKGFMKYFAGDEDSKGRRYFPVKPGFFIFTICFVMVPVLAFTIPSLAFFMSAGIVAPLLIGYMDYKLYRALNQTKQEKRENKLKNLLKFTN